MEQGLPAVVTLPFPAGGGGTSWGCGASHGSLWGCVEGSSINTAALTAFSLCWGFGHKIVGRDCWRALGPASPGAGDPQGSGDHAARVWIPPEGRSWPSVRLHIPSLGLGQGRVDGCGAASSSRGIYTATCPSLGTLPSLPPPRWHQGNSCLY